MWGLTWICASQGVLDQLSSHQIRQIFQRFPAQSPASEPEQRLAYFKAQIWPRLRDTGTNGDAIKFIIATAPLLALNTHAGIYYLQLAR